MGARVVTCRIVALLLPEMKNRIPLLQAAAERHSMALAGAVFRPVAG